MRRGIGIIVALLAALTAHPAVAQSRSPFEDWSAIVVAGDWRAHSGQPTEAFDNARRDVAAALTAIGFRPENVMQFSTRPERYGDTRPRRLTVAAMTEALKAATTRNRGGCLVYYTSHGTPQGAVLDVKGDMLLFSPPQMAAMIDEACPGRPAIVFVSACFSGVFVPWLEGRQRMVMTAARSDRSSFGCGEGDKYPFFDDCFLQSVDKVRNFPALPPAVQGCVAAKEQELGLGPPSQPQAAIGADLRLALSLMPFPVGARSTGSP